MTDFNIATGAEQPINRTGVEDCQVAGENQGLPVGIQDNGDGTYSLVKADGDSTVAIPAVGVLFPEEVFDAATLPTGSHFVDLEEQLVHENKTLLGDRAVFVRYGIEMVNDDDDTAFTPGEPVLLGPGGGFTQTEPASTSGDLRQVVGVALTPDDQGRDRVLLEVEADYTVA